MDEHRKESKTLSAQRVYKQRQETTDCYNQMAAHKEAMKIYGMPNLDTPALRKFKEDLNPDWNLIGGLTVRYRNLKLEEVSILKASICQQLPLREI